MPNRLTLVESIADIRSTIDRFNRHAVANADRALSVLRSTTFWVYDPASRTFGPSKFVGFVGMTFTRYEQATVGDYDGVRFNGSLTRKAIANVLRVEYAQDDALRGD